jgi:diguanylate cyclase (GGDEF)-like protein/PAS domain S-box-containing protein
MKWMAPSVNEAQLQWHWKDRWSVLSATDGIEALLGYTAADFLASRVLVQERVHAHDAELAARLFDPGAEEASGVLHLRLRHADGGIRVLRGEFARETRANGERVLNLLLQDVRSLWREQGSMAQTLNFRAVMESTDDYIYFKDRNHVLTGVSRTLVSLTRSIEEWTDLLGKTDYEVYPEAFADKYYKLEQDIFAGVPVAHEIRETVSTDGRRGWVDNRKYPLYDDHGEIVGLFGIARDITAQVRAEETLRQSEEWLRDSQEIAGVGSYSHDVRSGAWSSSPVLDEIFGIDEDYPHTVEGWVQIIHPDDRAGMNVYFADEVVGKGVRFDREYRIVRQSDGAVRWVHGLGRLDLDGDGLPWRMRGTIQDVTEGKLAESSLRESKELLQKFFEHAPVSMAIFDTAMRYMAVTRRWMEDNQLTGREIIGECHYDVIPNIPEEWRQGHRRGLSGETLSGEEDPLRRADGSLSWIRWEQIPWHTGDGAVGGIILVAEDVTQEKEAKERLQLAASVFTNAREAILITSLDGCILDVNQAFTQITGYNREEVLGKNPRLLKSGRQSKDYYANMWASLTATGQWSGEIWNRAKNGRIFPAMQTISAVHNAHGEVQHYVALTFDITELKEHERKLEHFALYDPLTGLPNRVFLADRMHQAMAHCRRYHEVVGVVYLDLDAFKAVNDNHGHDVGDELLGEIAKRMKGVLREGDTLARLGGDEFVAVLLDLESPEVSVTVIERLLAAVAEPVEVGPLTLQVSASIGVTFFPQPEEVDADQLLRQADQAMYQAKLQGRNRFALFDSTVDRSIRGHHEEVGRIRKGLAAREFVLYYQPKVNLRAGTVVGAEALIRWRHPQRGLLLPGSFLPVIEDHPLAVEVGEWVIETALRQMEIWGAQGLDLPVSVNMGARQLQQADFVERLEALLKAHPSVSPASLELEILETSALQDVAQTSKVLKRCIDLGVNFSLDDFGAGYSSLIYLKQLPARVLKIDRSFVCNILEDPEDLTILEGVLGLGFSFRRQCIAEGVETVEQGTMLLRMGCDLAQGFGIARPMPAEEMPGWIAAWRPEPSWRDVVPFTTEERRVLHTGVEIRAWLAEYAKSH